MSRVVRVCPFCGEPPGAGVFCAACGRNLAAVDRLPTGDEWAAEPAARGEPGGAAADAAGASAERCAAATAAFLASMREAGCPGTTKFPTPGAKAGFLSRTPQATGWVVRPVVWDDPDNPRRHEPGLVLTTDGEFLVLESQIRGWGQRSFPQFYETVAAEPVEMPVDERLIGDLEAVLREHGLDRGPAA
jgi:hypothetical protein